MQSRIWCNKARSNFTNCRLQSCEAYEMDHQNETVREAFFKRNRFNTRYVFKLWLKKLHQWMQGH